MRHGGLISRRLFIGLIGPVLLVAVNSEAADNAIPLRFIDGKLCALGRLQNQQKSVAANFVIDLGMPVGMVVHEKTAKMLGIDNGRKAVVEMGAITLPDIPAYVSSLRSLEELTANYSKELGEIPAVAVLGLPAFASYLLEIDISGGTLILHSPEASNSMVANLASSKAVLKLPYAVRDNGYWLKGLANGDYELKVRFSTGTLDTRIDLVTADLAGAPGGEIDDLTVGDLNIAKYVALRPEDLSGMSRPAPDVILGNNLLSHFRIFIDGVNNQFFWEPLKEATFPTHEREYFVARSAEDADKIEDFLQHHSGSRLACEAADNLLALRREEGSESHDSLVRAINLKCQTLPKSRRAAVMIALADDWLADERADKYPLAEACLEMGEPFVADDENATASYQLQARKGMIALKKGDLAAAHKHLLGAAFGMPKDAKVNLWLGQLYEAQGKLPRAWSRYAQAVISKEIPPEAMQGLNRLHQDVDFRAKFSMEDAEQMLEGRVIEFHPESRFVEENHPQGTQVHLVELFTCLDQPVTQAAELAFQGIQDYFSGQDVSLVSYHLAAPNVNPLITPTGDRRADFYNIQKLPAAFFNGQNELNDNGDEKAAGALYLKYQKASLGHTYAEGWNLGGQAFLTGEQISGFVKVTAPGGVGELRVHILFCETLFLPGQNGILLHRNLARKSLSPLDGYSIKGGVSEEIIPFRLDPKALSRELEKNLDDLETAGQIRFWMKPAFVDVLNARIVAFIQDPVNKQVYEAVTLFIQSSSQ